MRKRTTIGATLTAMLLGASLLAPATASGQPTTAASHGSDHIDLNDGIQIGSQDIFFLDAAGILRNPDGQTPDDEPLFSHSGVPLDLTWGDYRGAEAHSLALVPRRTDDTTIVVVKLDGLVPDGVYSLFSITFGPDSENPDCPGALRDLPVTLVVGGTPRPDPSAFTADRRGRARLIGVADGDLLAAEASSMQVIYHADGETYHPLPNRAASETQGENCVSSYGEDAMRQAFILQKWPF